jgi:hypothetical protein
MANTNWSNAGHFYAPQVKPVLLNCSFVVDSTNANGLGIRSLKGPGISAVYMNTSATPASGNPNPAAGLIVVKLRENFQRYLGGFSGFVSPVTGSNITLSGGTLVAGKAYIITGLGTTTTAANWVTAGVPLGYSAAVGVPFIATAAAAAGTGLGNATVKAVGTSGVYGMEVVGDTNLTIGGQTAAGPTGAQLIIQVLGPTSTSNPTPVLKAPANESVIGLSFYLSDSSITVSGQ